MSNFNPYASPQTVGMQGLPNQMYGFGSGMWRQGEILVVTKGLMFPERCPVTNEPAKTRYSYEFSYLSPEARAAGAMFGALGAAVANSMASKANYEIPLADSYVSSYRTNLAIGFGLLFGAIGALVGGGILMEQSEALGGTLLVIGLIGLVASIIWFFVTRRELGVHYVSESHCWISGANEQFLATLPPWPHEVK